MSKKNVSKSLTKQSPNSKYNTNHFVLFWLGLLTGALIVGLLFFYKGLTPLEYQTNIFNWRKWFSTPKVEKRISMPPVAQPKLDAAPAPFELPANDGFVAPDLHPAGFVAPDLHPAGFVAPDLKPNR